MSMIRRSTGRNSSLSSSSGLRLVVKGYVSIADTYMLWYHLYGQIYTLFL